MVYAYRLKNTKGESRMVEGFGIRRTWQFSSDPKTEILSKWPMVVFLKDENIKALKEQIAKFDRENRNEQAAGQSAPSQSPSSALFSSPAGADSPASDELKTKLENMELNELKQYAKNKGIKENVYSGMTKTKLVEHLLAEGK